MDTLKAELTAKAKMREHGLDGWAFGWQRAVNALGTCNYRKQTIFLSRSYVELNPEELVMDTIMHEIAHALVGPGKGHGPVWKAMARKLGAKPASKKTAETKQGRFMAECPGCLKRFRKHRRTKTACKDCCVRYNGGKYSPSFAFRWYEVEEYAA